MMSAFEEHREELEHYEQMFGSRSGAAGGVARPLDERARARRPARRLLCTSQRNPAVPAMDLRIINQELVPRKRIGAVCDGRIALARTRKG